MKQNIIKIPKKFENVLYKTSRIPGVENESDLTKGANCQLFIYNILRYFGKEIPPFRSSELWTDTKFTNIVTTFKPLDIMLYNKTTDAYGAHIGLYIGEGKVFHLSKENGTPKYEKHSSLLKQQKYKFFIGAKRVKLV